MAESLTAAWTVYMVKTLCVGAVRNEYFDGAGSEKYKIRILHEAFSYVHGHH